MYVPEYSRQSASASEVLSGPLINAAASKRVRSELAKTEDAKAEVIRSKRKIDGSSPKGAEHLIPPTLVLAPGQITRLPAQMQSLQQEEIFAPVMTAGRFEDLDEWVRVINSSRYGLQLGVFTQNLAAIQKLYREVEVGGVMVNDVPTSRYDHQPYGGVKDSGQGREGLRYAMEEMTYSKFLSLSSEFPH